MLEKLAENLEEKEEAAVRTAYWRKRWNSELRDVRKVLVNFLDGEFEMREKNKKRGVIPFLRSAFSFPPSLSREIPVQVRGRSYDLVVYSPTENPENEEIRVSLYDHSGRRLSVFVPTMGFYERRPSLIGPIRWKSDTVKEIEKIKEDIVPLLEIQIKKDQVTHS